MRHGLLYALGLAAMIALLGGIVILFQLSLHPRMDLWAERLVGVTLIVLATYVLSNLVREDPKAIPAARSPYHSRLARKVKPMPSFLQILFNVKAGRTRVKITGIYGILLVFNLAAWFWALVAFHRYPVLLGTAFLAYSFGLRHAVDADHIAAIDNVTRKLMQEGKRPVAVGFMFSLGHSTIVVLGSVVIAGTALALHHRIDAAREIGGLIGTLVSTLFLFGIAIVNLVILRAIYGAFQRVRSGEPYVEKDFDLLLGNRGFLSRLFRPMFRMIRSSWHMYPLGVLFGLGFDTATEIGLLGISAAEASKGLSLWSVLVFPALFAAGMSLIDTTDNILMLGAYGWAFVKPIRLVATALPMAPLLLTIMPLDQLITETVKMVF